MYQAILSSKEPPDLPHCGTNQHEKQIEQHCEEKSAKNASRFLMQLESFIGSCLRAGADRTRPQDTVICPKNLSGHRFSYVHTIGCGLDSI